MPAVSEMITGIPSKSKWTSMTSLVVPAFSETMAASLLERKFNKLDFPTLGGPIIAILKPSLIISPVLSSSKVFFISFLIFSHFNVISFVISVGISSSGKSILASISASTFINFFINLC